MPPAWTEEDSRALKIAVREATWKLLNTTGVPLSYVESYVHKWYPTLREEGYTSLEVLLAPLVKEGIVQVAGGDLVSGLLSLSSSVRVPGPEAMELLKRRFAEERDPQKREIVVRGFVTRTILTLQEGCLGLSLGDMRLAGNLASSLNCQAYELLPLVEHAQQELIQDGQLYWRQNSPEAPDGQPRIFCRRAPSDLEVQEALSHLRSSHPWDPQPAKVSTPAQRQAGPASEQETSDESSSEERPPSAAAPGAGTADSPAAPKATAQQAQSKQPEAVIVLDSESESDSDSDLRVVDTAGQGSTAGTCGMSNGLLEVVEDKGTQRKGSRQEHRTSADGMGQRHRIEDLIAAAAVPHNQSAAHLPNVQAAASHQHWQAAGNTGSGARDEAPRGPGFLPRKRPLRSLDDDSPAAQPRFQSQGAVSVGPPSSKRRRQSQDQATVLPAGGEIPQQASKAGPTPLHREILQFVARVTPGPQEQALVQASLQAIQAAAAAIWPKADARIFGSQAMQLAMTGGDVDIVILNVRNPSSADFGTSIGEKNAAARDLRKLEQRLRSDGIMDQRRPSQLISAAKVPIIKCYLKPQGFAGSCPADISLHNRSGVDAAKIISSHITAMPPAKPLTLVLKRMLKERGVNEVHTGGLSSFSLVNMVIAHLMVEGYSLAGKTRPNVETDLGKLLWGFLVRFGVSFDYYDQAVSILQGGIIRKRSDWRIRFKPERLAVESPLRDGKEIAGGSYRIMEIKAKFASAANALEKAMRQAQDEEEELAGWHVIQQEAQHRNASRALPSSTLSSIISWQ